MLLLIAFIPYSVGCQGTTLDNNGGKASGEFTIVAYNVQNLFDLDGISKYDDFKPDHYRPSQLQRKLQSITDTLSKIGDGTGPEIVLLQEIELDRTANEHKSATELLKEALDKKGLGPYHLAKGRIEDLPLEKSPSIVCVTLSKFPIKKTLNHWTERALPHGVPHEPALGLTRHRVEGNPRRS